MQTGASNSAAAVALFTKLIDYAGLFPPAQLPMEEAIAQYTAERAGRYAWMLGRFIVQQSRIAELVHGLSSDQRFYVSVILDRNVDGLSNLARVRQNEPALRVEALEAVLAPDRIDTFAAALRSHALSEFPAYVEIVRGPDWERVVPQAMAAFSEAGLGAKIRCGGVHASAFPTPSEVATFIYWACRYNVPFKATAGLHHPIRHFDASVGTHMHGFLNVLAAAALARAGMDANELVEPLSCEEPARFGVDDAGLRFGDCCVGVAELESTRREAFVGYGSCSFTEPVDDLRAMRVLS